MDQFIKGNYRHSIYESGTGFIIGLFKVRETNIDDMKDYIDKTITFKGYFDTLNTNDLYIFYGEGMNHPKYGFQFDVKEYEKVKPEGRDGIIEFLSSNLFKGVGKKLATRIVDVLGSDTLDKIYENKEVLYEVPKLKKDKADFIYDTLVKYEESQSTIIYLTGLGFSMKDSLEIYNYYKNNTINILKHNPYKIVEDISNINFIKIDEVSKLLEIDPLDKRRIEACILYLMDQLSFENGDTYSLYEEIYDRINKYLKIGLDEVLFSECLDELEADLKIVVENNKYYLIDIYDAEVAIANKIKYLISKPKDNIKNLNKLITESEENYQIKYNDSQKEAIKKALNNNITIITGGPGTGKTTIINAIVYLYKRIYGYKQNEASNHIQLLAPTGRASKRMSEATTFPATTIHRFLKWNHETDEFSVNEYNPDFHHLIIVDEVSMIDNNLFDKLLKGLTNNIKLVLVGDYNQLPSVGAGNILKDLLDSNIIDTIHLDYLYRQNSDSYIPVLAKEIRENKLSNFLDNRDDYRFVKCDKNYIIKNLIDVCNMAINKGYNYKRVQVMAPMYASVNGIDNLNKILQNIFNPKDDTKKEIKYGDVIYREQDKVLQLVNLPDDNVFNGDIGIIIKIKEPHESSSGKKELVIDFDGNIVTYQPKDYINIKHGFIMSIHKSQGSEFELVVMPICTSYKRMLYRKLIYTGITRAKRKLILIGEEEAFRYSVENSNESIRKTSLLERLK